MLHKLRALGVMVAMLTLSAVAAPVAHGQDLFVAGEGVGDAKYKVDQYPSGWLELKTAGGNFSCEIIHAEETRNAIAKDIDLTGAEYKKCALGGLSASLNFGTCKTTLDPDGSLSLAPAGCKLTITSWICTLTVPGDQQLDVAYESVKEAGKNELKAKVTSTGIQYSLSKSCPNGGKFYSNGIWQGTLRLRSTDLSGNPIDLAIDTNPEFQAGGGTGTADIALEQDPSTPLQTLELPGLELGEPLLECEKVEAEGPESSAQGAVIGLFNIEYNEGCSVSGISASANFSKCQYILTVDGGVEIVPGPGWLETGCEGYFTFSSLNCMIEVPGDQIFSDAVAYENVQEPGEPVEVSARLNFSGVAYREIGNTLPCPFSNKGEQSDGLYNGVVRLKAFDAEGTQIDFAIR